MPRRCRVRAILLLIVLALHHRATEARWGVRSPSSLRPLLALQNESTSFLESLRGSWAAPMRWRKFLRRQCAEFASGSVWEAGNTDLNNVFQICSSNAFGLASPLVSPKPFGHSTIAANATAQADSLIHGLMVSDYEAPDLTRQSHCGPVRDLHLGRVWEVASLGPIILISF